MKPYRHRRRKHRSGTITHRARREGDEPVWRPVRSIRALRREEGEPESTTVRGYGLEWGDVYDGGWFTESFRQGAFSDTLEGVRLKVGHDHRTLAIARSPGTMEVGEDDDGLFYAAVAWTAATIWRKRSIPQSSAATWTARVSDSGLSRRS